MIRSILGQEVLVIFACYTTVRAPGIHTPRRMIPERYSVNGAGNVSGRHY